MSFGIKKSNRGIRQVRGLVVTTWLVLGSASTKLDGQTAASRQPASSAWEEHFVAAQMAQKNQDYEMAEREYRAVLALKPGFAEVHMNLGLVYQLVDRTSDAMTEFRRALKLKPALTGANFFLGVDYCKEGDGPKAIPYLRAAARAEPNRADILSWLATAEEMSGEIHTEIMTLRKALSLQPQNVDLLYLLGHAYERLGKDQVATLRKIAPDSARTEQLLGESYSASNQWPSAVLHFQNALNTSPGIPGVHVELGEVLLRQGKVKRALEEIEEELKLDSLSFRAIVRRGEIKLIQGDLNSALQDWTQVLDTDALQAATILGIQETGFGDAAFDQLPEDLRKEIQAGSENLQKQNTPAAHFALAFLAMQSANAEASAAEFTLADVIAANRGGLASCSEHTVRETLEKEQYSLARDCALSLLKMTSPAEFRLLVARALFELGDYQASLDVLSKLTVPDNSSSEAAYWRARCYEKLATAAYLKLYQADPNSYRMHQLMGDLAAAKNDDGKAIEEYRAAIFLKPSLPNLHYSLGHVLWKDLKVNEAREAFEDELKIDPRHPGALNELGDTYLLEHQPEKALHFLEMAMALEPNNPDFHRDLGTAYSELHQYEKAAREFRIAVSGDHDGSVHYKLARVYQSMGEKEKAAHEFALSTALNRESHSKLEKQTERLGEIEKWTRE